MWGEGRGGGGSGVLQCGPAAAAALSTRAAAGQRPCCSNGKVFECTAVPGNYMVGRGREGGREGRREGGERGERSGGRGEGGGTRKKPPALRIGRICQKECDGFRRIFHSHPSQDFFLQQLLTSLTSSAILNATLFFPAAIIFSCSPSQKKKVTAYIFPMQRDYFFLVSITLFLGVIIFSWQQSFSFSLQ
jgi:hypothetical protein